jgi:glycosyltransferase involved in cell wall biosynthesis
MYAMFRHLQDEAYDLVHVSEWRGSAYFCLVAKRQGIAFRNTVFCVKSSSPWLWNRKHGLHTIDQPTDLVKMFAERRSIELADLVVGGSAHLLRWMLEHGYRLPENRTFVQPNVAMPADIPANLLDNRPPPGSRVPVREIVFFGRLEHRKGLDIFCEAINNLVREGVEIPPITFMGKFGARIPTHPELTVEQYIKHQAQQWPCKWQIIDNCGQAEALTYLLGEGRLAIMPSVIENSSLAVYETTQYAIPFIASDVGGTPELILKDHRDNVLTPPHPVPLSAKIREALEIGGFVAAGSFDNDANLRTWLNFHSNMAVILDHEGWPPKNLLGDDAVHRMAKVAALPKTSVCLVLEDDIHRIGPTLDRLLEDVTGEFEIILVAAGGRAAGTTDWLDEQKKRAEQRRKCLRVFHQPRIGLSAGRNFAASKANGDYLLFVDPNAHPKKNAIETFAAVAQQRQADILLSFYDRRTQASYASDGDYIRVLCLAEDPGFTFYDAASRNPLVYVRKSVFSALGGFTTDYRVPGSVEEFLASAILANKLVETVPEALADEISDYTDLERYNRNAALMRKIRPHIAALPLCYEPILMVARSLEANLRVLQGKHNSLREKLKETEQKVRDLSARPFPKSVAALVEERLPTFARRPFRLVLRARAWALVRLGK